MDGDQLSDFSLQIQHRGWENNGEMTYFYTIKSVDGVLTLDNQLGKDPWTFTTFTLTEEHKARLASEEGLDFVVYFDSVNQKMELYIYTSHELKQLQSLSTYYGSMSNFYKVKYVLTEEATVSTKIYKTYDSTVEDVYEELGLVLSDHVLVEVDAVAPTCEEDGVVAHKVCIMCGATFDLENKALDSIVDPKTGHNYSTELTKGETTHYYACLNANCDSKFDEEPHNMVFTETKVPATEEVDGIEIWTCSVCGKQEERNIGKLAHTHTYKDSYSYDGTSHWYDATCGHDVKGGLEDHTFVEYEEVPPTCNETGTIAYKECSVCHAKYDLEGNEVNLTDFFGKPIILNFWASWCGPCKMEMPDFNEAYSTYKDEIEFPKWATNSVQEQCYNSARIILEGNKFCPEDVLYQAGFKQGSGVYKEYPGYYFCYE